MSRPTQEQIAKLPKWAQEHIENLAGERDTAIRALNEFLDNQTESAIHYDDVLCLGEKDGSRAPSYKRRYVQTHKLTIEFAGVNMDILLSEGGSQRIPGIHLQWHTIKRGVTGAAAMVPTSYQSCVMTTKEHLD